jgi:hypothetical protein
MCFRVRSTSTARCCCWRTQRAAAREFNQTDLVFTVRTCGHAPLLTGELDGGDRQLSPIGLLPTSPGHDDDLGALDDPRDPAGVIPRARRMPTITARQKSRRCTCGRDAAVGALAGRTRPPLRPVRRRFDNHRTGDTFSTATTCCRRGQGSCSARRLSLYTSYSVAPAARRRAAGLTCSRLRSINATRSGAKWDLPNGIHRHV